MIMVLLSLVDVGTIYNYGQTYGLLYNNLSILRLLIYFFFCNQFVESVCEEVMKMFIKINYAKVQTNYEIAVYIMQSDMRF